MPHSAQLAFNLPFDSARWKGSKYSQYFGLSLKPGNQWCFLLIREFVGKCSWISRGSSSLVCLDLVIADAVSAGESIAQYLTLPKVGLVGVKRFFLLGGHYVFLVVLGSRPSLGVVQALTRGRRSLIGSWRGQEGHSLDWFRVLGASRPRGAYSWVVAREWIVTGDRRSQEGRSLDWFCDWVFTGNVEVKRVFLF
ncbi:hypothetical protein EDB89DRAFT_1910095 [Lactarius sanguifluus]|nr:hypothetical protein EDB89DRAFT_1910095 [Lactarius sanguifluus]